MPDERADPAGRLPSPGLVLLVAALVLLIGLPLFPLQEPDEGRYADIASAMLRTGDWITPHLDGIAYFEKPPLVFWCVAASQAVFGLNPFSARLPSALACLAVLVLLVRWAGPAFDRATASLAALLFATLPLVILLSRVLLVDFVLTATSAAALLAAWHGLVRPGADERPRRVAIAAFWLACAFGFLAKGPIGLALPGASIGAYLLLTRDVHRIGALLRPDGPLLFALVVAPWYAAMDALHPHFLYDFFVEQNVERLTTGGRFDRQAPLWFYLPVLAVGCLPWIGAAPSAFARVVRARHVLGTTVAGRTRLYLACAVLAPLALLSVAHSKLPYYVLPILPPLTLLLADDLALRFLPRPGAAIESTRGARLGYLLGGGLVLAGAIAALVPLLGDPSQLASLAERVPEGLRGESVHPELLTQLASVLRRMALALALLAAGLLTAASLVRRDALRGALAAAAGLFAFSLGWAAMLGAAGPIYSSESAARLVLDNARPDEPVICFGTFVRGVPYYLQRPVALWYASKAEFGQDIGDDELPELAFQRRPEALQRFVAAHASVLVLVNGRDDLEKLAQLLPDRPRVVDETAAYTLLRYGH
ncbi:MAG: glycosyltransferase family 39 protein [Planctomycetes bacterium]|nr:glycosyltransferase family 39 protein [Planctomycetota bacterium]